VYVASPNNIVDEGLCADSVVLLLVASSNDIVDEGLWDKLQCLISFPKKLKGNIIRRSNKE
jgi:hypothetical protein